MTILTKEIRTPEKNLLIGVLVVENNIPYLVIKNRGKEDRISVELILSEIKTLPLLDL